jgi:hypothetical protein
MITLNYLVRKKPAVSADDFRGHWLGRHAEKSLELTHKLGIRKYTKCETQHADDVNMLLQRLYGTAGDAYDFVDQMVINDLADFKKGLADQDVRATLEVLHEGDSAYVDFSRSDCWFSIDVPQVFSAADCTATWNNTYLKAFYVPRRQSHLSLAQAQLHWMSCHGAMARQFIRFLPYERYVQGHRIESKVIDELKDMLGGGFEDIDAGIGQAEAWIDRRIVPSLQGPEVERMMGMLVADIALFVDAGKSHIFATKEHVILNQPVITEPIPSLFSAD